MDEATKQASLTILRIVLGIIGAEVTKLGWADDATVQTIIGALITIGAGIWAWQASRHKVKKADEREAVAFNAGIKYSNQSPDPVPPVPKEEAKAVIQTITEGTKP